MFKLKSHKSDRLGERIEFRFSSFQAFQIPKGWDRLVLSLVSVETGKTVAKASKATVRSGTCQWTETFSESMWTPQDDVSKEMEDCVFKLVVSMGSLRSGILGELTINLIDYMSSRDSGSLSLPLKKCNYGTILQVRIQCLNPKRGLRDIKSSKGPAPYLESLHSTNDHVDSKSDGSDINRSLGSSSGNNLGVNPEEPGQRDTSFSASGSHRSSDSGDSSISRLNFSPRNNLNGGTYMGRQDSAGSHISATSGAGPTDEFSKSSFNSRASGPSTLRGSGSSKELLEAAEETIEELQDEAKMWERHSQKLKQDIEKLKKECADRSKRQTELDVELSSACSERDSLKKEVEKLKSSLEEVIAKQTATTAFKNEVVSSAHKELEDEVKFLKESNANLNLQLQKIQEANLELVSILEELEETVEKQKFEMANLPLQTPKSEYEGDILSQKLLDVEAEWEAKLSAKEEEIRKLERRLAGMHNAEYPSEQELDHSPDLLNEIEELRDKVKDLERDCAELTEENLELIFKLKNSGKDVKEDKDSESFDSETQFLKAQIHQLEEELKTKEMLNGGLTEPSAIQCKNLERKCADLEAELQYFKDQACHLDTKLRDSQLEVEGKMAELTELQQRLENFKFTGMEERDTEARGGSSKKDAQNDSDIEELKFAFSLKEKEIDLLKHAKEELEVLVTDIRRDKSQLEENLSSILKESSITSKCLEDVQHEVTLLAASVDSHISANKVLERKSVELELSKNELEIQVSELEEENIELSEHISGLEAQLRDLTDENESTRLELEDFKNIAEDFDEEAAKQQADFETQKGEMRQKLSDAQRRLSEAQEETEYLKRSHSKLQSTIESLIEENDSLQKSNGDLRKQKLELHERSALLEVALGEARKKASEFLKKVEVLELKLSSMQNDIVSKEKVLTSQLESVLQEQEDQEEKLSQAKLMLSQMDTENTVEVENLKREIVHLSSQLSATQDERQQMASDAVLEVSNLRSDKIKLESNLQETLAKLNLCESELQSLRKESGKKVQGLVDLLNASKQSEEMLMSDINNMQRQIEVAKSDEENFNKVSSELELKLKASDYEKQQLMEETSSLKIQVQKVAHLQEEISVLKSSLEEVRFEKRNLEESLQSISEECEGLKTERMLFMEKMSIIQKAVHDGEDKRHNKIALEEKLLTLEGDSSTKEAFYANESELKNEINQIKRANIEYQRKIQHLEEENCELLRKFQVLKGEENHDIVDKSGAKSSSSEHDDKQPQRNDVGGLADAAVSEKVNNNKLHDLEVTIQDLEAKIRLLESQLAEAVEANNMYKIQLQGLMAEKRDSNSEAPKKSTDDDTGLRQCCKIAALEAELKGMQQATKMASLETELKEMKERYLHMSLQYAEVEAQREELVLKLRSATGKGKGWFS